MGRVRAGLAKHGVDLGLARHEAATKAGKRDSKARARAWGDNDESKEA